MATTAPRGSRSGSRWVRVRVRVRVRGRGRVIFRARVRIRIGLSIAHPTLTLIRALGM